MSIQSNYHNDESQTDEFGYSVKFQRQEFARRLFNLLQTKGMTQSDLSRRSGINKDSISRYMSGRNYPRPESTKKIADALNVSKDELFPQAQEKAYDTEHQAIELRQAVGHPDKAWLRVNRALSFETAAKIIQLINEDDQANADVDSE